VTAATPFDIAEDGIGVGKGVPQIEADFAAPRIEGADWGNPFYGDRTWWWNKDISTNTDGCRLPGLQLDIWELVIGRSLTEPMAGQ
jgi:hypothetical protein